MKVLSLLIFLACLPALAPGSARAANHPVDLSGARLIEKYSNSATKYRLGDGSIAVIWSDGSTEVTRPDETIIQTWPPRGKNSEIRRVTYPDGVRESFYVGGGTKTIQRDGTIIETWQGEGKTEVRRITRPDGTVESFYANGGHKITRKDGSETMNWANGRIREIHADGSVWETSTAHRIVVNPEIIELARYPESVDPNARVIFKWKLKRGYADPWASILLPDGTVRTIPTESIRRQDGEFYLEVNFDAGSGRYKVEIIAVGRYGNEIAANFPVWVGAASPETGPPRLYLVADPKTPLDVLEKRFWAMVNSTHKKHGVSELPWNTEVAQIARNHARDMAISGYFGHISPTHGNLAQRAIKLFGWQTTIWGLPTGPPRGGQPNYIAENISRTNSLADALESLMESPAHRRLLLYPHFTSGGVGMSWGNYKGKRMLFIVTAMLQKNRPSAAPQPQPPAPIQPEPRGYHILGRDNDPDQ